MAPGRVQSQRTASPLAATPVQERAGIGNAPNVHGDEDEGSGWMGHSVSVAGHRTYARKIDVHDRDRMEDEGMKAVYGIWDTGTCGAGQQR